MKNVVEILQEREMVDSTTSQDLAEFTKERRFVYCGFDPTADSMHLGNMTPIMGLAWFQRCGHVPVIVLGGATGMIGDPSGKSVERQLLDETTVKKNLLGFQKCFKKVLDFETPETKPIILNNYDWFKKFDLLSFLRDVGKYFRVGIMLSKENVKARLKSEEGLSFTEFSYQLLQGYDFFHLYKHHNVTIQIGGSDQWGNILAGTDFVRKKLGKTVYGLTLPLLTTSEGKKFGKSEKGAIWLEPCRLSIFEFYQQLVRVRDADVIKLLRVLTFMDMKEIRQIEKAMGEDDYRANFAQKRLAEEVTRIIHGEEPLQKALKLTETVKPGKKTEITKELLETISQDMPPYLAEKNEVVDQKLINMMAKSGICKSISEARRLIKSGGVQLNNEKINDENFIISKENIIEKTFLLITVGKKRKTVIKIT